MDVPRRGYRAPPRVDHDGNEDDVPHAGDRAWREDRGAARADELFRLTYYYFPSEGAGPREALLYDAECVAIANVTREFHDQVCVQGSGRLASGDTVSFARRDCSCAAICPSTGQHICFERLDARHFPYGRGAMGRPITPLYTVAVDTDVIPLGASMFIPELVGMPQRDGSTHDGCFRAEDRGLKVRGLSVDVFAGDRATAALWRARLGAADGVRVVQNSPRCRMDARR
jgi:3D (Asp-Asp-Asp) domain-containing protein